MLVFVDHFRRYDMVATAEACLFRAFPDSKVYQLGGWSNFNETYSYTSLLDPTDERFTEIGNKFVAEVTDLLIV